MGLSDRPWYLQHRYLNNKRKEKGKRKESIDKTILDKMKK